ncbi:uncharacterized protein LOC127082694 [Lathyrus oleraceus]|uniref:uncharacterized protein LOC127082694 n=1 Tax=Pisum sativum TaxID=3888 RepID=UPI0021D2A5A8|nr:uncharacterized protein LOC127082694 [Pisum sativum]
MMQAIQQIQRDQHDYANWDDQGMAELSEEMHALTHRVDAIQEYTQYMGSDPSQHGRSEHAQARVRAQKLKTHHTNGCKIYKRKEKPVAGWFRGDGESRTTPRNDVAAGNGECGVVPEGEDCGVSPPPPPPPAGNVEAPMNGNGEAVAAGNGEGVAVGNGEGYGEGVAAENGKGNGEGVVAGNGEGVATGNGEGNDEGVAAGNVEGVADPEEEDSVGCCFGFSCAPKDSMVDPRGWEEMFGQGIDKFTYVEFGNIGPGSNTDGDGESRTTPRNGVVAGNGEGSVVPEGEDYLGCCFGFSCGSKGGGNQQGGSPPPPPLALAGNVEAPINGSGEGFAAENGNGEDVAAENGEGNGEGVAAGNGEGVATGNGEGNDEGVIAGNGECVVDHEEEDCVGCFFGFSCGPKGDGKSCTTPRNGVAAGNDEGGVVPEGEDSVGCCFRFSCGQKGGGNQQGVSPPPPPPPAGNVEAPINGNGEGVAVENGEGVATGNGEGNDEGLVARIGECVADPEEEDCVGFCFGFSCGPKGRGNQEGVSPPHPPPKASI